MKRIQFADSMIGHLVPLEIAPYAFLRIQLRRIGRKRVYRQSAVSLDETLHHFGSMGCDPIPQHDHISSKMNQDVSQKSKYFLLRNVGIRVPMKIESQASALGRNRQPADTGDFFVASRAMMENRRLAFGSPGAFDRRKHAKAAFVHKYEMSPFTSGVFLYVANLWLTSEQSPFRLVRSHVSPASDKTSPVRPEVVGYDRRDNERRNVVRSPGRCGGKSTSRWKNREPADLSAVASPRASFGKHSGGVFAPVRVWPIALRRHAFEMPATNVSRCCDEHPLPERLERSGGLLVPTPPLAVGGVPTLLHCLEVS